MNRLLVTGGAGYIGRHLVKALGKKGYELLIYDNLAAGHARSVLFGDLVCGDLLDAEKLENVMAEFQPEGVIHLASYSVVPESVEKPLFYYQNNVQGSLVLFQCMKAAGVKKLIFSSSAAVYGEPEQVPVKETAPLKPVNPYEKAKVMVEEVMEDLARCGDLDYISLRYFNVAGADPVGELGEERESATHLITRCVRAAAGALEGIHVYGTDYPTGDGTCVRDYIHVQDLVEAHLNSLEYLGEGDESGGEIFNCGYGRGYSVKEVIETARKVTGVDIPVSYEERRPGDAPVLVADNGKIRAKLGWKPRHDSLEQIIYSAWQWERKRVGLEAF